MPFVKFIGNGSIDLTLRPEALKMSPLWEILYVDVDSVTFCLILLSVSV